MSEPSGSSGPLTVKGPELVGGPPTPVAEPSGAFSPISADEAHSLLVRLQRAVAETVIGGDDVVRALTIALAVEGHVLVEGVPGIAKTYLARTFARSLGLSFQRIQFTPDMLPADILGGLVMDPRDRSFVYRPGPIFAQVILADEINRAPPKVQSALLEAMQEQQVTVDRRSYPLPRPFLVIATENPLEQEGTYPMPEAELDRFLFRWIMSYPSPEDEATIVRSQLDPGDVPPGSEILSSGEIERLRRSIRSVNVDEEVVRYVIDIVRATRADQHLEAGGSPRAAVQFMRAVRAAAFLSGRDYVVPDDVQELIFPILNHRIIVRPEFRGARFLPGDPRGRLEVIRTLLADNLRTVSAPR
ncbi:MAG TPA: MoxR family ATPase [Thermoplasmata archaeon]|nr:MoxR family ATPase [Thermoplasmata archaeon]